MSPSRDTDLYDRARYADGAPHELFAHLRRTAPVHWQEIPGQAGFWTLLRHADVAWASRHPELLSSELGGITVEDMDADALEGMRQMLLGMDPPRHRVPGSRGRSRGFEDPGRSRPLAGHFGPAGDG